ncbi:WGxxGxxG family protein [Pseudaminobacter sp. NGMCC 1.201702]|uniref:WGxxGxxG family protein n=1 Tax=Pseudaminobacter sp. NGMCC 1.201702 TaxID=3391825 RepID=UPI0039EF1834
MRNSTVAALAMIACLQTASIAMAQETPAEPPATATTDDDFDWGWIGLLGLVGLAGLAGRRHTSDTTRTR